MHVIIVPLHVMLTSKRLLTLGLLADEGACARIGVFVRVAVRLEVVCAVEPLATLVALPALGLGDRVDGGGGTGGSGDGGSALAGRGSTVSVGARGADGSNLGRLLLVLVGDGLDQRGGGHTILAGLDKVGGESIGKGAEHGGLGLVVGEVGLQVVKRPELFLVLGLSLGGEGVFKGRGRIVDVLLQLDLRLRWHDGGLAGVEVCLIQLRVLFFSLELDVLKVGGESVERIVGLSIVSILIRLIAEEGEVVEVVGIELEVGVVEHRRRGEEVSLRVGRTHRGAVAGVERVAVKRGEGGLVKCGSSLGGRAVSDDWLGGADSGVMSRGRHDLCGRSR